MRIDISKHLGSILWFLISLIIVVAIVVPTFLAHSHPNLFHLAHVLFSPTCHQLTSRSFCWFPEKMAIEDCTNHTVSYSKEIIVRKEGYEGYKFPVCARCFAIYLGLLLGATAFFFLSLFGLIPPDDMLPIALFLLAIVPLAIDGTIQLFTSYESTNQIRFFTGLLAGIATSFYASPLLNIFLSRLLSKLRSSPEHP